MSTGFNWDPPPLDSADQQLVSAYTRVGVPVDELPYTEEFEEIVSQVSPTNQNEDEKHRIFKRLLTLRKQGRLPRVTSPSS